MQKYPSIQSSSLKELLLLLLRQRWRVRVTGNSMLPMLKHGDEVLVDRHAYRQRAPQVGEVVVALHPQRDNFKLIKRVARVQPDGGCYLLGDNPEESSDSRTLGVIDGEYVLGRVTSRFG